MTTPLTGPEVRTRREALGMTLDELARRADTVSSTLDGWERSMTIPPAITRTRILAALLAAETASDTSSPSPSSATGIGPVGAPASGEGLCGAKLTDGFGMTVFCGRHPHDRSLKHRSGEPPSVTEWVDPAGAEDVDRAQVAALGSVEPGSWRDIMARTTAELAAVADALPEGEGTLPERVARLVQVAKGAVDVGALARVGAHRDALQREVDLERWRHGNTMGRAEKAEKEIAAALGCEPWADLARAARASRGTAEELRRLLEEARAAQGAWTEVARQCLQTNPGEDMLDACRRLRRETDEARAKVADMEAEVAQLAVDAAEWRAYRAAADARTNPGAADAVEAIAKACGLERHDETDLWKQGWWVLDSDPSRPDSGEALRVWRGGSGQWRTDDRGMGHPTELDVLRAYAAATGMTLPTPEPVPAPAPPRNPWPGAAVPAHYDLTPEPIEAIEGWGLGYHLGNVVKYISRAGRKPGATRLDDLRKAARYLAREIAREERQ